jgi:hypothetical protein
MRWLIWSVVRTHGVYSYVSTCSYILLSSADGYEKRRVASSRRWCDLADWMSRDNQETRILGNWCWQALGIYPLAALELKVMESRSFESLGSKCSLHNLSMAIYLRSSISSVSNPQELPYRCPVPYSLLKPIDNYRLGGRSWAQYQSLVI